MQDNNKIVELVSKYLNSELNDAELRELEDWKNADEGNRNWFDKVVEESYLFQEVRDTIKWEEEIWKKVEGKSGRVISLNWKKIFVAAAVSLIFGAGAFFMLREKEGKVVVKNEEKSLENDVKAPEINRAVITLDNGKKIYLDSVGNGVLLKEGNVSIAKLADGRIAYNQESDGGGREVVYNTLANPRGSKVINITLEDGSRVWLNSESSIKFPIKFDGNERKVEIMGEAYLEVTKNEKEPFRVVIPDRNYEIQVLGTRFNINAYKEEQFIKTSLLHGKLKVSSLRNNPVILYAGHDISLEKYSNKLIVNESADVDAAISWVHGAFYFNNAGLEQVLGQLARWYDVEVEYRGKASEEKYHGEIERTIPLAEVLKNLSKMGNVRLKLEDKKVVINP